MKRFLHIAWECLAFVAIVIGSICSIAVVLMGTGLFFRILFELFRRGWTAF
jgi:cytochrome c oxidase subunit IV